MKYRAERRRLRSRKIKQRINLIRNIWDKSGINLKLKEDGYFSNNNEVNAYMTSGKSKKTRVKNSHSNYRRKGGWGKTVQYKPYDLRQVEEMEDQLKEYNNEK